jgi:ABC-type transport system involved in cytochrome bd biosynthesis fused ATPase/permease subunit
MLFEHEQQLNRIEQKVDRLMAAQDDVNAAVTAITSFLGGLSTEVQAIAAALAAGGGTPVSTAALNSVIAQLPAAQAAVAALVPAAAPAPAAPVAS